MLHHNHGATFCLLRTSYARLLSRRCGQYVVYANPPCTRCEVAVMSRACDRGLPLDCPMWPL
jgi:hypothetical protein